MNHSNQLAIVDGNEVFTIDEQTELEKQIDHVIAAHKNNRQEINRLVFECTSALTAADDASHELASKGFFSRLIGAITGSNKRLQDKITQYEGRSVCFSGDDAEAGRTKSYDV